MTNAFVLSGGGSLGSVQVGMLQALAAHGVEPDLVVGTSVGALNSAWVATHQWPDGLDGLVSLWHGIRRHHVFPIQPLTGLLGFSGRRNYLVPSDNLERLLRSHLNVERIEQALIPLSVVATEVESGLEVLLSQGELVPALLASAAIPGIFPTVRIEDHDLFDGGVADNTPIAHAVSLGASVVWVLPTGYACALSRPPRNVFGMLLHMLTLFIEQRLIIDVAHFENEVELHLLPPLCPLAVSPFDFSSTAELIDRARDATMRWLAEGRPRHGQARFLGLHHHY
jgi:NTE family protein